VFYMDIAKVDRDVVCVAACKYSRGMLQAFVQNILSVSDICYKYFYLNVAHVSHTCCKSMFKTFQLF
jgi:hypothetical protein